MRGLLATRNQEAAGRVAAWILLLVAAAVGAALCLGLRAGPGGDPEGEVRQLAERMKLRPGMTVAEIGAGRGEMTVAMATLLGPASRFYSTDLDPSRVESIRETVDEAGLKNVVVLKAHKTQTNLPPGCCKAIFLSKVYHHFIDPDRMNASIAEALQPGGWLAIVDFEPSVWRFWLMRPSGVPENRGGHGMPKALLREELERAGFVLDQEIDPWWTGSRPRYGMIARKPAAATPTDLP